MVSAVLTWSQEYGYRLAHLVTLINIQTLQENRALPIALMLLPRCLLEILQEVLYPDFQKNITANDWVCGDRNNLSE